MFDSGLINDRSRVRAHLDFDKRDIIPRRGSLDIPVMYMDAIQLRICDLEFLESVDWITPTDHGTYINARTDMTNPAWYNHNTMQAILLKVFAFNHK